jgi:lipopolysaccharide heptosyltransferase II
MTSSPSPAAQTRSPRSLIVLAREHIGDLVCTTPALRSLRRLYPDTHISVEVGERAACVLENNPNIDEIILRPRHQGLRRKAEFVRLLRRRRFDLGVILDDSADMPLYLWLGGVPRRVGLTRKKRFAHLLTDPVPYDSEVHEMIDNFRRVVGHLGADIADASPELFIAPEDVQAVDRLLCSAGIRAEETLIALHSGASMQPKCWPPERFAELISRLSVLSGVRLLLLGGPQDRLRTEQIVAGMDAAPVVLTETTVMQQAEVQRRCAVLVTADTGPMHLACATGTPVVALFGPTNPRDFGPGYVPGNVVIRKVAGCPDCSWERCVHANRCMRAISAAEVAGIVLNLLQEH